MSEVVFVDTTVLLNVLNVPGKNGERSVVLPEFTRLTNAATLVLPVAVLVETGNHIAQLTGRPRRTCMQAFVKFLGAALDAAPPWVVSGTQWDVSFLHDLLHGSGIHPGLVDFATSGIGTGDASILLEIDRYKARTDIPSAAPVRLWTLDTALASRA